ACGGGAGACLLDRHESGYALEEKIKGLGERLRGEGEICYAEQADGFEQGAYGGQRVAATVQGKSGDSAVAAREVDCGRQAVKLRAMRLHVCPGAEHPLLLSGEQHK